jgi:hypothetical protein
MASRAHTLGVTARCPGLAWLPLSVAFWAGTTAPLMAWAVRGESFVDAAMTAVLTALMCSLAGQHAEELLGGDD